MGTLIDLTGQQFGKLTVLYRNGSINNHAAWLCQCECGNRTTVSSDKLRSGHTKSCGCLQKEKIAQVKRKNLIGQRFGRLTVTSPAFSKDQTWYWNCKCDCGNFTTVRGVDLSSGRTQSCGCFRSEQLHKKHLQSNVNIGKKYNHLTVLEYVGVDKRHQALYKCQCDCGNIKIIRGAKIKNGEIKSCGCIKSKGELLISQLLQKYKYDFVQEYSINECRGLKGGLLRFDFYINNTYIIEYDGQQHYEQTTRDTKEDFFIRQEHDKIKNEYCKTHNIPLIRIPYWHYNDITIEDLKPETSQFLIT